MIVYECMCTNDLFYFSSLFWLQRWRDLPQTPFIQRRHVSTIVRRSREDQGRVQRSSDAYTGEEPINPQRLMNVKLTVIAQPFFRTLISDRTRISSAETTLTMLTSCELGMMAYSCWRFLVRHASQTNMITNRVAGFCSVHCIWFYSDSIISQWVVIPLRTEVNIPVIGK